MCAEDGCRRRAGAGGFTLVEVLVAMSIVALVTPFLFAGLISSLTHARQAQNRGATTAWTQAEIEFLRTQCFQRLAPGIRKLTPAALRAGEPALPDGFAAGFVRLESAGPASLVASISLHERDWPGPDPPAASFFTTTTYIADLRVAGACP